MYIQLLYRSGSQYVTLSTALPILIAQIEQFKTSERDLPGIYTMKERLKNALNDRFDLSGTNDKVSLTACFFDPRFKVKFNFYAVCKVNQLSQI